MAAVETANPTPAAPTAASNPPTSAAAGSAANPSTATAATSASAAASSNSTHPMASLYVGDLHPDVNESTLYETFSAIGPVLSIRVCRDMLTRRSLGYAYVNFQHPADAERAIDIMNFNSLKGKPIRIMWSQRDPSLRRSGVGNIFIKNLDKVIGNKAIYDTFSSFGNILSCKVATDENGVSKGYGFVHFETEESATRAISRVNGCILNGRPVFVGKFIPKQERVRSSDGKTQVFTNCFVKNFPRDWNDQQLNELFAKYGSVTSCAVMRKDTGEPRGFGFVAYERPEDAAKAVDALHNSEQGGEAPLYVARHQKKAERLEELRREFQTKRNEVQKNRVNSNLYIKNLDDEITDDKLEEAFKEFGEISSCKIMVDERGKSRGFGFVAFANPDDATKAVTQMNGAQLGNKPLYVAPAQRKEDRMAMMQNHMLNRMPQGFRSMQPHSLPYQFMPPGMGMPPGYAQRGPQTPYFPPGGFAPGMRGPNPIQQWARPAHYGMGPTGQSYNRNARQQRPIGGMDRRNPGMPPMDQQRASAQQMGQRQQGPPSSGPMSANQQQQASGGVKQYSAVAAAPAQPAPQPASMRAGRQQPQQAAQVPRGVAQPQPNSEPIDPQALASMTKTEQKQLLGERLYPLVHSLCQDQSGKVTGMLLDSMEHTDILVLLDSAGFDTLKSKVSEARNMIEQHRNKPAASAADAKK